MKIRSMFEKDINRPINGVIKVAQDGDEDIRQELEEYVITNELQRHFTTLFLAYDRALDVPTDRIGVWISGFFGSGKSHFLKMLSYLLSNRTVAGRPALGYFEPKLSHNPELLGLVRRAAQVPCESILFNIDSVSDIKKDRSAILRAFSRVFYEHCGFYGKDLKLARLERRIDQMGKTDAFRAAYEEAAGAPWVEDRENYVFNTDELAEALSAAGVMSSQNALSWIESPEDVSYSIDEFASEVKDYTDRRAAQLGQDFRLLFMVDEVGQYIGDDVGLMLNLQTIVEDLGASCAGRVWVMVTSQEAIDEVSTKLQGNDFSKIQGRFSTRLSLSSSSVDEVIKRRILEKTVEAHDLLCARYANDSAVLTNLYSFDQARSDLVGYSGAEDFAETYPFVGYQFPLLQAVFEGVRKHGTGGMHLSTGERSMLSGFQEAAQAVQDQDDGAVVPFWRFYDTLHEFLEGYIQRVVVRADTAARSGDKGLELADVPVLKLLFLLKYVDSELKATLNNVAILMAPAIDADIVAIRSDVQASLDRLVNQNYVGRDGEVYSFLTDEEQDVAREIKNTPVDPADVAASMASCLFGDIYQSTKASVGKNDFTLERRLDGAVYSGRGGSLVLQVVDPYDEVSSSAMALAGRSTEDGGACVACLESGLDYFDLLRDAARIDRYARTNNVAAMSEERQAIVRAKQGQRNRLVAEAKKLLEQAVMGATFYICGTQASPKGTTPATRLDDALTQLVARRYPKLGLIEKNYDSDADIEQIMNEPQVIDGPALNGDAAEEVASWLQVMAQRGMSVSVGAAQRHFRDVPYGWREADIAAVLALLARDRRVEVWRAGVEIPARDPKMVRYLRVRSEVDQVELRPHTAVDPAVVGAVCRLYREVFNASPEHTDEDGLHADLAKSLEDLHNRFQRRLGDTYHHEPRYPGRQQTEDACKLLGQLLGADHGASRLFNAFLKAEDDLLDIVDDLGSLDSFFGSTQKKLFDEALGLCDFMAPDHSYLEDDGPASEALSRIVQILKMPAPYKDIPSLAELVKTVRVSHSAILQAHKRDVCARVDQTCGGLMDYAAQKGVADQFDLRIKEQASARKKQVEGSVRIVEVDAASSQLESFESQMSGAIAQRADELAKKAREEARHQQASDGSSSQRRPHPVDLRPTKVAKLSRSTVCPLRYLANEDDVNAYIEKLRTELLARLADADAIQLTK